MTLKRRRGLLIVGLAILSLFVCAVVAGTYWGTGPSLRCENSVEDGGHTWPGGQSIPGVGKTSRDIDATDEMWRFFQMYRLDGQP